MVVSWGWYPEQLFLGSGEGGGKFTSKFQKSSDLAFLFFKYWPKAIFILQKLRVFFYVNNSINSVRFLTFCKMVVIIPLPDLLVHN